VRTSGGAEGGEVRYLNLGGGEEKFKGTSREQITARCKVLLLKNGGERRRGGTLERLVEEGKEKARNGVGEPDTGNEAKKEKVRKKRDVDTGGGSVEKGKKYVELDQSKRKKRGPEWKQPYLTTMVRKLGEAGRVRRGEKKDTGGPARLVQVKK